MSTIAYTEKQLKAIEYAKNYPHVVKDTTLMGPFTLGNITQHNGRTIINICLRTEKSFPFNATISYPNDWAKSKEFSKGELVNAQIVNGLVSKITKAKAEAVPTDKPAAKPAVSANAVNDAVANIIDETSANAAIQEAITKRDEVMAGAEAGSQDDLPF